MIKNILRNTLLIICLAGGMFFIQESILANSNLPYTPPSIPTEESNNSNTENENIKKIQEIKSKIKIQQEKAEKLTETIRATEKGTFKDKLSVLNSQFLELNSESKKEEYQSILDQYEKLIANEQTKKAIIEYKRIPPVRSGGILPGPDRNYSGGDYIKKKFIPKFINAAITLLFSVSIVILIVSGVMYIIASGDQDAIKKAKDMSLWAIAGTLLAIFSFTIVKFIIGINFGG